MYGRDIVGGFAGEAGGKFTACYATGKVFANEQGTYKQSFVGGFAGSRGQTSGFTNCYTSSDIYVVNNTYTGAFGGGKWYGEPCENCYALGDITIEVRNVDLSVAYASDKYYVGVFFSMGSENATAYYSSKQTITFLNEEGFTIRETRSTYGTATDLENAEKTASFFSSKLKWESVFYNFSEEKGASIILWNAREAVSRAKDGLCYYQVTVEDSADYMVEAGRSVSLTAGEQAGKTFLGWYIDGECVSTEATFVYTPTASVKVEAKFE